MMDVAMRWRTGNRARGALAVLLGAVAIAAAGCGRGGTQLSVAEAATLTGGNPARGRVEIRAWGCGSCHTIQGVTGANSLVGPPLTGIAQRAYIGGVIANTPANIVRWIQNPQAIDSLTAMPNLNVPPSVARDMAAYLYSLQ